MIGPQWFRALFSVAPLLQSADLDALRRQRAAASRLHTSAGRHAGAIADRSGADVMPASVAQARDGLRETVEELIRRTR